MRSKKHKVKLLCQIQADRTSAPKATTSLCAAPCLPNPPRAHHLGCLCRAEPSRPGSGEAAGVILTPRAGGQAGQGVVS